MARHSESLSTSYPASPVGGAAAGTVWDDIARAAADVPEMAAIRCAGKGIVYRDLVRHVDDQANRILEATGGRREFVAVYGDRSPETIVNILASMKAGCPYVPLDRQYPRNRIQFVLKDAGAPVIVTIPSARDDLLDIDVDVVALEFDRAGSRVPEKTPVSPPAGGSDAAYALYTSGSTGRPKAVVVTHENLRYSTGARFRYYPQRPERYLLLSSHAFDSSVAGIFWTLASGGTLVLPPKESEGDVGAIVETISGESVTHTLCLPSLYSAVLDRRHAGKLRSLRIVIVAGEACPARVARLHYEQLPDTVLYNEYGPTEATVWSSVYRATGREESANLPIGAAIPGTRIELLDELRRPVAQGDLGEIHVAGPGVASGYLNQPSLTDARFLPDPASPCGGQRMYRTGDLGRIGGSGEIEFAGRTDDQIKVRGYRIEPAEIEARLMESMEVDKAAVADGEDGLVAFVVPRQGNRIQASELQRRLRLILPAYMVPSAVTVVEDLPHLANGKVDRQALRRLQTGSAATGRPYKGPRDPLEYNLRGLFENVLNLRPVGIRDNFFDMGGHSLKAVELVNQIETVFDVFVPLPVLFESPTVAGVASYIRSSGRGSPAAAVVGLKTSGTRKPLFCVPGVGGHTLRHLKLPRYLDAEQPYYVFQAPGFDGKECLDRIEALAECYLEAMRNIQPDGPYLLAGECFGGIVAFEMARELHRVGEEVALLALIECFMPHKAAGRVQRFLDTLNVRYPWLFSRFVPKSTGSGGAASLDRGAGRKRVIAGREEILGAGIDGEQARADAPAHVKVRYANRAAGNAYRPSMYPGKLTLFLTPPRTPAFMDRRLLWQRYTSQPVEIYDVAGNANTMLREPDVCVLAEQLNRVIERIRGPGTE